jgi:tRNA (guanine-N7-)-methyltransferase
MAIERKESNQKWELVPLCYPASALTELTAKRRIVEVGPGRGDFLFHLAKTNPDAVIVAIELKSKRYFKLIDRIDKKRLTNVVLIQADARRVIRTYFQDANIDEIHVNFPDPWPKLRHTKNRVICKEFLKSCVGALAKGGTLTIITDSLPYFASMEKDSKVLEKEMKRLHTADDVFPTFFAQKWKKEGRKFNMMKWVKT